MPSNEDIVRVDWIISVDDHVIEPPGLWQERVAEQYRDRAPRVIVVDGDEIWEYEGKRFATEGLAAAAGQDKTEFSPNPVRYDQMRPGCYDPVARTADMDVDGIAASLCFPAFPRFAGQRFLEFDDKALALACVEAYNDWMIDEWCGSAPGRFIPLVILPLWDPARCAAEIERTAARGARAFVFSENAPALGLPSLYDEGHHWDPMLQAADDTGLAVCCHVGSSSRLPTTGPDTPPITSIALLQTPSAMNLVDWLFSGTFLRFPNVKLCLSEGGIGWIPSTLERAAYTLDRHRYWAARSGEELFGVSGTIPAEVMEMDLYATFRDHVFGCFIDDRFGARHLDEIGVDNVMVESDYPHTDSTWPNTRTVLAECLAGRSADDVYKISRGNAQRVFNFEPAIPEGVGN